MSGRHFSRAGRKQLERPDIGAVFLHLDDAASGNDLFQASPFGCVDKIVMNETNIYHISRDGQRRVHSIFSVSGSCCLYIFLV